MGFFYVTGHGDISGQGYLLGFFGGFLICLVLLVFTKLIKLGYAICSAQGRQQEKRRIAISNYDSINNETDIEVGSETDKDEKKLINFMMMFFFLIWCILIIAFLYPPTIEE